MATSSKFSLSTCVCACVPACVCESKCEAQDPLQPERDGQRFERWDFSCCRWEPPAAEAHSRLLRSLFLSLRLFDKLSLSEKQAVTVYAKSSTVFSLFMHQVPFFQLLPFSRFVLLPLFFFTWMFFSPCSWFPALHFSSLMLYCLFLLYLTDSRFLSAHLAFSLYLRLVSPSQLVISATVTRTHVPCSSLLPITLECAQSRSHVNTHLMQAVRAYTHLLGKLQRGREANHTSSPSLFSQVWASPFFFPQL